ncbi:hypothetical protein SAMN05421504_10156 [Amycolatopsis xylanica]|uniref:Uncharacterized protein n=1 Tax=Amycolatopsis xylanica TaxID=589385 RepID=A0A1H2RZJ4_9PSEU|nr:hypothetical protein [Amycolatopsis xylanica]SDW24590.1 hypothetical protein SAMN05421504_10156 [Amycolatopsis xylanica]
MRARIEVGGDDFASLREWLAGEPGLRGLITPGNAPIRPGEMGGVTDVLVATLGDGGAVAALAAALGTWLGTRRSKVRLKVTNARGESVELDIHSKDAEKVVRALLENPDEKAG